MHPAGADRPVPPPPAPSRPDDHVDGLSRRVPGTAFSPGADDVPVPNASGPDDPTVAPDPSADPVASTPGLTHRSPGHHLSHKPPEPAPPSLDGEPRPRPERVHDLLARHLRGIREGRTGAPPEGDDNQAQTEEHR